jgi:FHA domain
MYKVQLVLKDKDGQNLRIQIRKARFLIGRHESCDYVLDDARSSRQHCVIVRRGLEVQVEDLNSRNGTFINGVAISPNFATRVFHDDALVVGITQMRFSIRDDKTNQPQTPQSCGVKDPRQSDPLGEQHLDTLVAQLDAMLAELPPIKSNSVESTVTAEELQQAKSQHQDAVSSSMQSTSASSLVDASKDDVVRKTAEASKAMEPRKSSKLDQTSEPSGTSETIETKVETGGPQKMPGRLKRKTSNSREAAADALKNLFKR